MKGAIFDLDGTLLDSMPLWDRLGEEYLLRQNITPPPGLAETLKSMSLEQSAQYFVQIGALKQPDEIVQEIHQMIEDAYLYRLPLKPAAGEYVKHLAETGVKLCVATATAHSLAVAALKRLGIWQYFSFLLSCEELHTSKDSPLIFEEAARRLQFDRQEIMVFEDALHAIQTAKAAGFCVTAVYDPSADMDQDAIKALADHTIRSFDCCLPSQK